MKDKDGKDTAFYFWVWSINQLPIQKILQGDDSSQKSHKDWRLQLDKGDTGDCGDSRGGSGVRREEPQGLEQEDGEPSAADEGVNGGKKEIVGTAEKGWWEARRWQGET